MTLLSGTVSILVVFLATTPLTEFLSLSSLLELRNHLTTDRQNAAILSSRMSLKMLSPIFASRMYHAILLPRRRLTPRQNRPILRLVLTTPPHKRLPLILPLLRLTPRTPQLPMPTRTLRRRPALVVVVVEAVGTPMRSVLTSTRTVTLGLFHSYFLTTPALTCFVLSACGDKHSDNDLIVAINIHFYGDTSKKSPYCGKTVEIVNLNNGNTVKAIATGEYDVPVEH